MFLLSKIIMELLSPQTQLQEPIKSLCGEILGSGPSEHFLYVDGILLLGSFRMEIEHYIKYAFKRWEVSEDLYPKLIIPATSTIGCSHSPN